MGARWDGRRAAVLLGALLVLLATPVPPGNAPSGIPEGSEARAAPACTYAISPTNQAIPAGGVSVTVRVSAPAGCSWSTYNAQPWVTVVSGSGSGNGTVTIVVAANPSTRTRAGTVLVAGQPFTVMQAEGPSGCSYSVAPSSQSVGARGGSGNVSVSAPAGCAWVASSTVSWMAVTSGVSGSGAGTVAYAVQPNPDTNSRSGAILIAGQSFSVTQAARYRACTYRISSGQASVGFGGGAGSVTVQAPGNCSWSASSGEGWITITSGGSGRGSGVVNYTVAANPSTGPRAGSLSIAGQSFTITQPGAICTYSVSAAPTFVASGGTGVVVVAAPVGCTWAAGVSVDWITITGGTFGNGNGVVTYAVTPNSTASPRTGLLLIGGQAVALVQVAAQAPTPLPPPPPQPAAGCTYTLTPGALFGPGPTGTVMVTAPGGCAWTAGTAAGWITIASGSSGSGNGVVNFTLTPGLELRTATLIIAGQAVGVTQASGACMFLVFPTTQVAGVNGGLGSVSVTASSGCSWTAGSNADWITITSGAGVTGNGTVGYTVAPNPGGSARTGTITVAGQTVTVAQAGRTP